MITRTQRLACLLLSCLCVTPAVTADELADAARRRDTTEVRTLIARKADVNAPAPDGSTALHWAAHWNDTGMLTELLRAGARVNATNDYGATALWLACANRSGAMVIMLLSAGADPNIPLTDGETTLMRCAYSGSAAGVSALLAKGADINAAEPSQHQTALMWAAAQRHPEVVQVLLQHSADVHARTKARGQWVGNGKAGPSGPAGDPEMMEIAEGGFTALLFAAQQGDIESAKLLLGAGADVDDVAANKASALVISSHSGHEEFAAFLLDAGANANAADAGYSALHVAILRGQLALVEALLAHGASADTRIIKGTAVRRFAYQWVIPAVFIDATPFWLAARYAEVDIMRKLVASGADTRSPLRDGTTPLMAAAGVGWSSLNSDRRNRSLSTDVVTAEAANEHRTLDAVKTALGIGADVNAVNADGDTALHGAATKGFEAVVRLLVEKGGRLDVRNKAGRTPEELLARARTTRE